LDLGCRDRTSRSTGGIGIGVETAGRQFAQQAAIQPVAKSISLIVAVAQGAGVATSVAAVNARRFAEAVASRYAEDDMIGGLKALEQAATRA
jgi:hypothetical protein